jgi:hypothetical protein
MKTLCAWCDALIREGSLPVSHGICVRCRQQFFKKDAGVSLQTFIDTFSFPVFVMGNSLQPIAVNKSGLESSHLASQITNDTTLGNIVECERARLPGGCGKTVHCSGCVLRKTLEHTNQTGDPAFMVPAAIYTNSQEVVLYVSTLKADGRIFVKLDKAES